jgi:toxin CcdB
LARFDVYANPDPADRKLIPYLLDVQNDFLDALDTRVVVPLWAGAALAARTRRLNVELEVAGKKVVMDTASLGAIPGQELRKPVANLAANRLAIQDALDTLFGSY